VAVVEVGAGFALTAGGADDFVAAVVTAGTRRSKVEDEVSGFEAAESDCAVEAAGGLILILLVTILFEYSGRL
jgi:hypothetical protein